jgi:hypothetical protein
MYILITWTEPLYNVLYFKTSWNFVDVVNVYYFVCRFIKKSEVSISFFLNWLSVYNRILFSHKEEWNLSFAGKWTELENIILNEFSQDQKAKNHIFSHMRCKPHTNAAIFWKTVHMKGRSHTRGVGQKKETKKVNMVIYFMYKMNIIFLNLLNPS